MYEPTHIADAVAIAKDKVAHEGSVYFDIRFTLVTPNKERIKLLINVEAQKSFYPGYDLVTRGVYYGARMISSQKEREFTGRDYDNIKKVYSIWICMDTPSYAQNTITEYSIQPTKLYGDFGGSARYDLLTVVMICLGDPDKGFPIDQTTYSKLLRLLSMISSHKVSVEQKLAMLEQEYHIATTRKLEEEFNTMCNWSEAIIERIRRDVENEFTDEVKNKIRDKVTNEIRNEIRNEVTNEIRNEVTNEIRNEVTNEIRNEVTNEIRNEVTNEIRNEVTNEIRNRVTNEATQKSNERAIINIMSSLECSFEKACEILKLNPTDYASLKKGLISTTI